MKYMTRKYLMKSTHVDLHCEKHKIGVQEKSHECMKLIFYLIKYCNFMRNI